MTNSRQKGASGERKIANLLKERGFESARRGQQFSGTPDSPDVKCDELKEFHFEVKFIKQLRLYEFYSKALEDSGGDQCPVIVSKAPRKPIMASMEFADWVDLIQLAKGKVDAYNNLVKNIGIWDNERQEYRPIDRSGETAGSSGGLAESDQESPQGKISGGGGSDPGGSDSDLL